MKHRSFALLLGVLCLTVACTAPQEPVRSGPSATYTMEQFMKTVTVFGGSFNPDESKLLVSTNETWVFNVYVIDLATGDRTAVTSSDDSTFAVSFFPEDERLFFRRDKGGNENNHLFLREPDGTTTDLTEGEQTKEEFRGWSHDMKSFFTVNNSRDPRFFYMYEWDAGTLEKRMLYRNEGGFLLDEISPDKRWLVLLKYTTRNDSDLYVVDLVQGGEPRHISAHEGEAMFQAADFSVDSGFLYYTANDQGEFAALRRYDLGNDTHEEVFATDWDVSFAYFSFNDTFQVIGTNEDGYTRVRITRTATGEELELPELPAGMVTNVSFSRSESKMRFFVSSDTMPRNLFLYDLESGELKQLTDTLNPEIVSDDLVSSEVVRFTARDGMVIPGPLYKPIGAGPDNRVPALVWVHGGPGGQSRAGYRAEQQFLVNHGYALFAVNNRGSSGYGRTFFAADDGKHGREPLWDCVDAKQYLQTLDWVDPERIGIIGGSYGGYMVLAALAFEPEEFAVGVDIFGVSNWLRTLKSMPPYWEAIREALYREMGNPTTDEQNLYDISPVFHGDKITRPLMVLQGANDPRVLQAESDDMVAAIRANGGIVEYLIFDDEGHGFRKSENRIKGYAAILSFLDTHLKGLAGAAPETGGTG